MRMKLDKFLFEWLLPLILIEMVIIVQILIIDLFITII